MSQSLSRSNDSLRFRHRPYAFDTSSVVPLRSSSCQSPDLVLSRPFPSVLTTMAFNHSRRRWFGTCSYKPVPRDLPSSVKQLRTLEPYQSYVLVAHSRRRTGRTCDRVVPVLCPTRRVECSTATVIGAHLAGSLLSAPSSVLLTSFRLAGICESSAAHAYL